MPEPPLMRQAALMKALGRWAHRTAPPGWDELRLLLKPVGESVHVRIEEVRAGTTTVRSGELPAGSDAAAAVHELRDLLYTHPAGTWQTFLVHLHAEGWPNPTITLDGVANYDDEPPVWEAADDDLTAADLLEDYTQYPRSREATPEWVVRRVAEAGLHLPYIPAEEVGPAPRRGRWPLLDGLETGAHPRGRGRAHAPDGPRAGAHPEPPEPSPRRPVPRLGAAPERLTVLADRDGVPRRDGRRPQRRRRSVDGRVGMRDLLEDLGVPLTFADGRGVWLVVRGTSAAEGAHLLGVVAQAPGGAEVHVTTDHPPWQYADERGVLEVYYRSVPAPAEEVVAAAELGEVWTPPGPRGPVPDNVPVRRALARYSADPGPERGMDVLRQALGGRLLLDCTGTVIGADGRPERVVVNFITAPDGEKALPAFTEHAELLAFRHDDDGSTRSLVQPAHGVLEFFVGDGDAAWLYLNPAGPPLGIHRDQVDQALRPGHNAAVKNALMGAGPNGAPLPAAAGPDGAPGLQLLFDALRADDGVLFLAEKEGDGARRTLLLTDDEGRAVLPAFTSAVEVAVFDGELVFERFDVATVLDVLVGSGAYALRLNPGGPTADLPADQARRFLGGWPA